MLLGWIAACFDFQDYSFPPKGTSGSGGLADCLASGGDQVTCTNPINADPNGDAGGAVTTPTCQPGDGPRCQDRVPEVCSDGSWLAQAACNLACVNGKCTECTNGTRCQDGAVETCREGFWGNPTPCPVTCEQGQCVEACIEDRTQCNGDTLQRCTGGEYIDAERCAITCVSAPTGDRCGGDCQPSEPRCAEGTDGSLLNAIQDCTPDAVWSDTTTPCGSAFCVNGACKSCRPDSVRCGTAGPERCSVDGEWVPQTACGAEAPACLGGACVLCPPAERRCFEGAVELCNDSGTAWTAQQVCTADTPACLDSTKTCGRCAQGDRQCSGDSVQTCDAQGNYQTNTTCTGMSPDCVGGSCKACDPAAGDTRCASTTGLQRCVDGDWGTTTPCTGDLSVCREDLGRCGCEENARRCAGDGTPERCVGGSWVRQARCTGGTPVCLATSGQCVACQPNSEICQNSIVQRCDNLGAYQSTGQCGSAQRNCGNCGIGGPCNANGDCRSGACVAGACAECRPTATECVGSTPRTCSNGRWVNGTACTGDTPVCTPATATCACQDGAIRCAGTTAERRCMGGQFAQFPCPSGSACDGSNRCVVTRKPRGSSCTTGSECLDNVCVDGVCCDQACNGLCETCATTGVCRAAADDGMCAPVACSALDSECVTTPTNITTNLCKAQGVCKTQVDCGVIRHGSPCQSVLGGGGICDQGDCKRQFVTCGNSDCQIGANGCCIPIEGGTPRCTNYDSCSTIAGAPEAFASCDQNSDCAAGGTCVATSDGLLIQCAYANPPTLPICDSPAIPDNMADCADGNRCSRGVPAGLAPEGWGFCSLAIR